MIDELTIKEIYDRYKNMLYNFILYQVKNQHDAEDIFSKTFVKLAKYGENNEIRLETVKPFLFKIASNLIKDFFRKKKIRRFVTLDFLDRPFTPGKEALFKEPDPGYAVDLKNMVSEINQKLQELPTNQKEAFYLRFAEGFSFAEIAATQSVPVSTVLSRVRYAVLKLKSLFQEEYKEDMR